MSCGAIAHYEKPRFSCRSRQQARKDGTDTSALMTSHTLSATRAAEGEIHSGKAAYISFESFIHEEGWAFHLVGLEQYHVVHILTCREHSE